MPTKMVIVMRKDLNMRTGKIASQAAHAALKAILDLGYHDPDNKMLYHIMMSKGEIIEWINGTFTKICVYVNSEEELLSIYNLARKKGIVGSLIQDSGKTEFHGVPTYTCCAIGPDDSRIIDSITGDLPLY